jgi:hypothetical protein
MIRPVLLLSLTLASCVSTATTSEPAATASASAPGGFISATVCSFAGPSSPVRLSTAVAFWDEARAGCSQSAIGSCTVRTCTPATPGAHAPSSGDVKLDFGATAPLSLAVDASGRYPNPAGKVDPWSPETPVRFTSSGAEVPSLDVTLAAPAPLNVLEPDPLAAGAAGVAIDRGTGFTARWVPGEGQVRVALRQESVDGAKAFDGGVAIDCFYDRAAGAGEVPAAALASLATGDANAMVYGTRRTHVAAGRYDVAVLVNTGGVFERATIR